MLRYILRRLVVIPIILILVNFVGYTYAHLTLPVRLAQTPYPGQRPDLGPLLPAYGGYLQDLSRLDFGSQPVGRERVPVTEVVGTAFGASLGLMALALTLSVLLGLPLGLVAARPEPRGIARWFTLISTAGLAAPSFYIGNLLILVTVSLISLGLAGTRTPLPVYGFGWDLHLVLPLLALIARPTVQIAQLTAGVLVDELGKRYVVTARSIGQPWRVIRWNYALRNGLSSIVVAVAGSTRLLLGELILVEWLFGWPGLGRLLSQTLIPPALSANLSVSPLFLNPPVVATVLTAFAAFFLVIDLVSAVLARAVDPRLRAREEGTTGIGVTASQVASVHRNWHLILGSVLLLLVVVVTAVGPSLAPQDPLEEHAVARVGDDWEKAPFPPFTVPGFPLGSDQFGRDTLSRLLWGLYPTIVVVTIVALVRLTLGSAIGMFAGWTSGRISRMLDSGIAGALSLPVLIVALIVIAAVGIEAGIPALIFGLAVTGWGETARLVREQTQLVKGQQHIEAAEALGGSDLRILWRHVLPHIMPMVWMLLALEISATLITTAGLGFLGYYVGGDIWVSVDDRVARRLSGTPELGQILAENSGITVVLSNPWPMLVAGTFVFVAVLGFNLLGEGLRRQLGLEKQRRETALSRTMRRAGWWGQERLWGPLAAQIRRRPLRIAAVGLVLLIGAGGLIGWRLLATRTTSTPGVALPVPGGHLWADVLHDPYGTLQIPAAGPRDPRVLWTFQDPSGFYTGLVVAADGTLYIASQGGTLYALNPEGQVLWQEQLAAVPAGTPALGPTGDIYMVDQEAALSAYTPQGQLRWRLQPADEVRRAGTPTVGPTGIVYYLLGDRMRAVRPDGTLLWESALPEGYRSGLARFNPVGEWLFWNRDGVIDARDGVLLGLKAPVDEAWYFTGADGRVYFIAANTVAQCRMDASGVEVLESVSVDVNRIGLPSSAIPDGVQVTANQHVWMYYGWAWGTVRIVWLESGGSVLGTVNYQLAWSSAIAADGEETIYSCGLTSEDLLEAKPICMAFAPGAREPLWELQLEPRTRLRDVAVFSGGALLPGRLYVTTFDGSLYTVGDP